MNKVILIGNLTKDPELMTTTSGVSVAKFTLAVQRKFKNESGNYETDFINCVAWRNTADNIKKFVKKGNKLGVVGAIQTRTYETQDGDKRYITEVVVDEIELLTPKANDGTEKTETKEQAKMEQVDDDSLPF